MIQVEHLGKHYGNHEVLKGVSFQVHENEVFALLGPNGAGKTTTLECIEGLRSYDSGSIEIQGGKPESAIIDGIIGIQLQSSSLPSNITPKEAMTLFCKWRKTAVREDLLKRFGIQAFASKPYRTLSTGQKRRLHLALALAHEPKILILDEPTAGLDVEAKAVLHQEIRRMKEGGMTIIMASHDMAEVEALCDRVAILVEGQIRKIGTPNDIVLEVRKESIIKLRTQPKLQEPSCESVEFLGEKGDYQLYRTENPVTGIQEILQFVHAQKLELLDLSLDKPTLEERFIAIAKEDV